MMIKSALHLMLLTAFLNLACAAAGFELSPKQAIYLQNRNGDAAEQKALQSCGDFLAAQLQQMTGWQLPVKTLAEAQIDGICLSVTADKLAIPDRLNDLERYTIEADGAVLCISSPTAIGVRHGVMAFLRGQGCRWLLPSLKWWIIPQVKTIRFTGKVTSAPAFTSRTIFYAYGPGTLPELGKNYTVWEQANQLGGACPFNTGHSYGNIIGRHTAEFEKHPEYYARGANGQVDPKKAAAAQKFCYSNQRLRDLCLQDRIILLKEQRKQNPLAFMVSMDPSDGEGTCSCDACAALGTTTDRVISLANHVAKGLQQEAPEAKVGLYAYSSHRVPPTITVEKNIHVEVAMAFNNTGLSYDELISQWGKKAGSLGIREYYAVEAWDWGLPGRMRGGNVSYHKQMIPFYLKHGAISLKAETNANWGGQALGLYVAARMLWEPTVDPEAVKEDFLTSAFCTAAPQMRKLYDYFETSPGLGVGSRARMLDMATAALNATNDAACRARITDIIAYLLYIDYLTRFQGCADGTEDYFKTLLDLMTYAHRIENRNVVHTYALARRLCNSNVKGRRDDFWLFGKDVAWKKGEPYADQEILDLAKATRIGYVQALKDRETYTQDYVLVKDLPGAVPPVSRKFNFRYRATVYIQPLVEKAYSFTVALDEKGQKINGALYPHPLGNAIWTFGADKNGEYRTPVSLKAGQVYRLQIETGGNTHAIDFPEDLAVAIEASEEQPCWIDMSGPFYVVVPPKTSELRCLGDPRLSLIYPGGKRQDISPEAIRNAEGFARVPVEEKEAGRVWQVWNQSRGQVFFLNVPPLIQLDSRNVLLPREVAEKFVK